MVDTFGNHRSTVYLSSSLCYHCVSTSCHSLSPKRSVEGTREEFVLWAVITDFLFIFSPTTYSRTHFHPLFDSSNINTLETSSSFIACFSSSSYFSSGMLWHTSFAIQP